MIKNNAKMLHRLTAQMLLLVLSCLPLGVHALRCVNPPATDPAQVALEFNRGADLCRKDWVLVSGTPYQKKWLDVELGWYAWAHHGKDRYMLDPNDPRRSVHFNKLAPVALRDFFCASHALEGFNWCREDIKAQLILGPNTNVIPSNPPGNPVAPTNPVPSTGNTVSSSNPVTVGIPSSSIDDGDVKKMVALLDKGITDTAQISLRNRWRVCKSDADCKVVTLGSACSGEKHVLYSTYLMPTISTSMKSMLLARQAADSILNDAKSCGVQSPDSTRPKAVCQLSYERRYKRGTCVLETGPSDVN